ncbi:HNH endonuclease [Pumilibacter intestinalis]|uniref:HNH endonuclease n=1 Tax=Pumilibacter intestinalis TaxID=2941511 RepID=UPI002040E311|nr:HNH endonuclease [Pumilibacter intestinalis]
MFAKRHRSYYTKEGYKQEYKPNSPEARSDGYVAVHRDVASRKIGRPLRSNEVVHHRDGNKRNNRPSNLQVMSRRKHWYVHHGKR